MTKNNQLKIDYLAFADDIALITSTIKTAQMQLPELQNRWQSHKWPLKNIISDQNKRSIKGNTHWHIPNEIQKVGRFKYLGGWITNNTNKK